jgi:hypothetical protein
LIGLSSDENAEVLAFQAKHHVGGGKLAEATLELHTVA